MTPHLSFRAWLQAHAEVARDSLTRLRAGGLSSLLTALMMGCALSLPASLWVLSDNAGAATRDWQRQFSVSLYLTDRISENQGRQLLTSLEKEPLVARGEYLSRADALAEFRQYSGFGRALDLLDDNPLPAVLVLWPEPEITADELDSWLAQIQKRPEVDMAQADSSWLQRLRALLDFGDKLIRAMGILLGVTVVLVVANTIRLDIQSRREEILVMKLIGAPDGFIQRPFLYSGALYGLIAGLIAWLSVSIILWLITPHLAALTASYGDDFDLRGLAADDALRLIAVATLMGWLGALQSVWRHLAEIEPD